MCVCLQEHTCLHFCVCLRVCVFLSASISSRSRRTFRSLAFCLDPALIADTEIITVAVLCYLLQSGVCVCACVCACVCLFVRVCVFVCVCFPVASLDLELEQGFLFFHF